MFVMRRRQCGRCGQGPVILVGHSLGGMTITQVAERMPERQAWLVYLTAMMPENGQNRVDLAAYEGPEKMAARRVISEDGLSSTIPEEMIQPTFYGECSPEDVAHAIERLVPQAMEPFQRKAETTPGNFGTVKRAYVECLRDKAIPIDMQRAMISAQPCDRVFTIDTDHSPFGVGSKTLGRSRDHQVLSVGIHEQVVDPLQPGEELVSVSAGDTVRWVVGDTISGSGDTARAHVLVKPISAGIRTNLMIATDRRTYHLELESTDGGYMAALSWRYPAVACQSEQRSQSRFTHLWT